MPTEPGLTDEMILAAAEQLATPEEREAYLKAAVGIDDGLQARAEQLLAARGAAGDRDDQTAVASPLPARLAQLRVEEAGQRLGHYVLLEQLGEGGFGTVWKAQQEEPVQRTVALKIIKPGMDTREVLARFEQERQALAMMDHPGIARVFDAGATDAGRPYFVMEFIAGIPVTQFCDARQLDTAARLRLVADICSAVQHAHQKGIIHRDIKPSNILVADSEEQPVPKVIDFGIAKAVDQPLTIDAFRTHLDQFIGTPAYMSPEQASLNGQDIDTRSDIYALGVLLYQLLTGTTPFESKTSRGASLEEIRRIIRDEPPPPPSTAVARLNQDVLTNVLKTRKTALKDLSLLLRRDLDWIVLKALEKDRNRRYETANALATDIRRYLAGEPVLARPPSFSYRAGKFVRKRKGPVASAAAILASLVGGLAASTTMYVREKEALGRESAARGKAQLESSMNAQTAKFLNDMLAGINPDEAKGADPTLMKKILARAADRVGKDLQGQPEIEAFLRNTIGSTYFSMGFAAEAKAQYEAGLHLAQQAPGPEAGLTLRLRGNMANIMHAEHDYPRAEGENRDILEIRERRFGAEDIESLATRVNLANAIAKQGRFQEAEAEYRKVYLLQQKVLTMEHPDTLRSRMALANVMSRNARGDAQKLAEAETEYRALILVMEALPALGPKAPETLEARYGLGDVLQLRRKFKEAEAEHGAVLDLRNEVLGNPFHKKILQSRSAVARALAGQGHLSEAEAEYRAILEAQKEAPQPDKSDYQSNLEALETVKRLRRK